MSCFVIDVDNPAYHVESKHNNKHQIKQQVRVEHVVKSRCQEDLKQRVAKNIALMKQGKKREKRAIAGQPRAACIIKKTKTIVDLRPEFFDPLKAYKV